MSRSNLSVLHVFSSSSACILTLSSNCENKMQFISFCFTQQQQSTLEVRIWRCEKRNADWSNSPTKNLASRMFNKDARSQKRSVVQSGRK